MDRAGAAALHQFARAPFAMQDLNFIQRFHRMSCIVKILKDAPPYAAEQQSGTQNRAAARTNREHKSDV
jgi:hypothetical protein